MNAADVLAQAEDDWIDEDAPPDATDPGLLYPFMVAALLAYGEQGQGVTIEADGDLHPKDPPMTTRLPDGTLWALEPAPLRTGWRGSGYTLAPVPVEEADV